MLSSNSFNLCPHCGNSNTLNARFCARCGTQLKVPEEVVVCRACGTRNSPMANFCRNCGSQLKVGEQTKICPRCRKEVPASDNTCSCGYSFATITTVAPTADTTASAREERRGKKQKGVRAGRAVRLPSLQWCSCLCLPTSLLLHKTSVQAFWHLTRDL